MSRQAGYVYLEVDWDLTSDAGGRTPSMKGRTPSMRDAGVSRIVAIPVNVFNLSIYEAPDEWVADWLSDNYGWCVNAWSFA